MMHSVGVRMRLIALGAAPAVLGGFVVCAGI
jgi:hypothetical protein